MKIENHHVAAIHRLPTNRNKDSLPIIVRFNDYDVRKELLYQARKKKLTGAVLDLAPSHQIFIDEHLTKETLNLWFATKTLRKRGAIFSTSCRDGKIKIKRTENSQPIRIRSQEQLRKMMVEMEEANSRAQGTKRTVEARSPESDTSHTQTLSQRSKIQRQQQLQAQQSTLDRFRVNGNVK